MIHDSHSHGEMGDESSLAEYAKFAGVIGFIVLASLLLASGAILSREFMRVFMGVFFVVFAGFKLADVKMFAVMYRGYDLIARPISWWGFVYPFVELVLGGLFLLDIAATPRNAVTLTLMTIGVVGVLLQLWQGNRIRCACLGKYIKLPLTTVSLVEDALMAVMALVMLI